VGIPCAIVGARLFFVAEHWGDFKDTPGDIIFDITEGGITLYGGLIGGLIGGLAWGLYHRWPIAIALDAAAPGMILGQGIGRIGDLINGEHLAETSGLPWAVEYTHPNTLGDLGVAVHPTAGGYELAGDLIIGALLLFVFRRYLRVPGWTFCSYVIMYGAMRFMFSYTRIDEATIGDIPVPQVVSALTVGLAVIGAGVLAKRPGPITQEYAERAWGDLPEDADANGDEPPAEPAGT
jgi:phosphatidylglycerol:prolipoprotein diacylglycerol transferase